jgi:hypothetical protein
MSVENIQKVNTLAQELLDKGFADSRDEAVQKAQEMLNKEIVGTNVEIKETDEKQNVASVAGDNEDRLKNMVERTKEQVERQLNGYKNALIALEKEIRALRQDVETLKSRAIHAKPGPAEEPQKVKPDPEEEPMKVDDPANEPQKVSEEGKPDPANEPQKVEEKQEGESHPKVGRTNSEEVSIEKMFYFGNK